MANITYPNGVASFQTLASAQAMSTTATTAGSIELGDGKPINEQAALGVVFHLTIDATGSSPDATGSFDWTFQASKDSGSTWFEIPEYNLNQSAVADETIRVLLFPFTFGANAVRVQHQVGTSAGGGTVTVKARLTNVFEVVGGV